MSSGDVGDSSERAFLPEPAARAGDAEICRDAAACPFCTWKVFEYYLAALLCPDGSSEELITGDPLPSWRLWVGKKRLLVSMQLPT